MSEIKKGFMVSMITTSDAGTVLCSTQVFTYSKEDAHRELSGFQMNCDPDLEFNGGVYQTKVTGKCAPRDPDSPTKFYYGTYCETSVRVDDLDDLYNSYEVEVEITRKWTIKIDVDEAENEEDAYDKAQDRVTFGDEDWRLDEPDNEYVEHLGCEQQ